MSINHVDKMRILNKIIELHAKGHQTTYIARESGVSTVTVLKWLREIGKEPNIKNFNNTREAQAKRKGRFAHLK
jgi:DNA invertase Pin-like site-specific DNA recombinase